MLIDGLGLVLCRYQGHGCVPQKGPGRQFCPSDAFVARRDRGSNFTHQWATQQWRCYSPVTLNTNNTHYVNGTCYCTVNDALAWLLCNCSHGDHCGPPPQPLPPPPPTPPPPAPNPPPDLSFVNVFQLNTTLNTCYRIPLILYTHAGTLLAVSEERYDAQHCPDNYPHGQPGGHNQVLRRSTDLGKTWGPIIRLVGSVENLHTIGGVDYTNPSLLNVQLPNGRSRILYQYSTQNNPCVSDHGHIIQMFSDDDGLSWGNITHNVSAQLAVGPAAKFPGATPGPCAGVQVGSKLVLCAWGSSGAKRFTPDWELGFGNFVYSSDDFGASWDAADPLIDGGFNECFVAALPNKSIVHISRRQMSSPHSYAIVTYSPDLSTRTPIRTLQGIDTPICEGSLVYGNEALYFAHPSSQTERTNLTIHKSTDGGSTWPAARVIWPGPDTSGYSGLTATPHGLALVFEGGSKQSGVWHDTWVKSTLVPYF